MEKKKYCLLVNRAAHHLVDLSLVVALGTELLNLLGLSLGEGHVASDLKVQGEDHNDAGCG